MTIKSANNGKAELALQPVIANTDLNKPKQRPALGKAVAGEQMLQEPVLDSAALSVL